MAIFEPKIVPKKIGTRQGAAAYGAEVYPLHEDDFNHNFEVDYFKIKLGYNGIQHYFPIIPKGVMQYLDAYNSAMYYTKNARINLKNLSEQAPPDSNFRKLVFIAYEGLMATTTVLSGLNPVTGTTGAATTATTFDFGYPFSSTSSSAKQRKVAAPVAPTSSKSGESSKSKRRDKDYDPEEEEEEEQEEEPVAFQQPGEVDDSPEITMKHDRQLKKLPTQCFCGKSGFKSTAEVDNHRAAVHTGHGKGKNPKTKKPKDYWKCHSCDEVSGDPRACWKHFRTNHLKNFIHYCPVPGCSHGNDQKDSIVSHILRAHPNDKVWVDKCHQQNWLRCKKCLKFFTSIKGKNKHEVLCGQPKVKLTCKFENCFKTYKNQETLDQHVETAHHGKGHKCLCPICGQGFSSEQSLDRHVNNMHQ